MFINHGALACLEALFEILHPSGFVLVNDYGPVCAEDVGNHIGVHRFGGSVALAVNFPLIEKILAARGFTIVAPEDDEGRRIHTRLIGRAIGDRTAQVLRKQFRLENDRWRDEPLEEARKHVAAGRANEAIAAYRTVVQRNPRDWQMIGEAAEYVGLQLKDYGAGQELARAALELNPWCSAWLWNVLGDPDARVMAAEVLEPIYVGQHRWHDLVRVYSAKLDGASDPEERLRLTLFVARLYEEQLEEYENACNWYAKVFREAPGDASVRDQLQRLGGIVEDWEFVAETYQQYLDDERSESEDVREVAVAVGAIYERRLNNVDAAYTAYRRALAIDVEEAVPNARELVRRFEEMLGRHQRHGELLAIYDDVIARSDEDLRREALVKRARLLEDGLQDATRAIDGWREVVIVSEGGETPVLEQTYRVAVGEFQPPKEMLTDNGRQYTTWRGVSRFEAELKKDRVAHIKSRPQHPMLLTSVSGPFWLAASDNRQ